MSPEQAVYLQTIHATGGATFAPTSGDVNINIHERSNLFRIEPIATVPPMDSADLLAQPSRLLQAEHRVIPFTGRDAEMHRLEQWRDESGPLGVLLLHSPGGHGKTRLALEFAEVSKGSGWTAWHAKAGGDNERGRVVFSGAADGAHLVLVDAADRWSHTALLRLCEAFHERPGTRTRLILTSRTTKGWWELREALKQMHVAPVNLPLAPLGTPEDRLELFAAARAAFAEKLGRSASPARTAPRALTGDAYSPVLACHMAALASVVGEDGATPPEGVDETAAYLLSSEFQYWEHLRSADKDFTSGYRASAQAVFTAVLTGPHADYRNAVAALRLAGVGGDHGQLLDDHRVLYPPSDPRNSLEPIYPDRLAEDFLALLIPGHGVTSFHSNPWAAAASIELLTRRPEDDAPAHTGQALVLLASAAERWPHLLPTLERILRADPGLPVLGGGAALFAVAKAPGLALDVLEQIAGRLPHRLELDFHPGAEALISAIAEERLASPQTSAAAKAFLLNEVGMVTSRIGAYDRAIDAFTESAALLRPLVEQDLLTHGVTLVNNLVNIAQAHVTQAGYADALNAIAEAEPLGRRLQSADHSFSPHELMQIMSVKSGVLRAMGRGADAAALDRQIAATLATSRADDRESLHVRANLAMSTANGYRESGDHDRAIATLDAERERLLEVEEGTTDHGIVLAMILFNLGTMLIEAGRFETARLRLEQALHLYEAFEPDNPGLVSHHRRIAEVALRQATTLVDRQNAGDPNVHRRVIRTAFKAQTFCRSPYVDAEGRVADLEQLDGDDVDFAIDALSQAEQLWAQGAKIRAVELAEKGTGIIERLARSGEFPEASASAGVARLQLAGMLHDQGDARGALTAIRASQDHFEAFMSSASESGAAAEVEAQVGNYCTAICVAIRIEERLGLHAEADASRARLDRVRPPGFECPV